MRVGRVIISAVSGLALVGAAGFGALEVRDNITESQKCEAVKSQRAVVRVSDAAPRVAVLGDSYTSGDGLDDRRQGWAYRVGTDVAGVGNTGYVNGGYCGNDSYDERIAAVLALSPDMLIIQGGLNDVKNLAAVRTAADALLSRAAGVPRMVLVGPPDVPSRDGEASVDAALRQAAETHGAQYVSALHWDLELLPDRTHMTPEGHEKFAQLVASAIR